MAMVMIGKGHKVLDVGAGDGGISQLIHDQGNEVVAFDLPDVIATVPKIRRNWLRCSSGDASQPWPFLDGEFDVVFAGEIIEHFIDIDTFMNEAWRVLKKDGLLVLTTPNAVREINRIGMLFGEVHLWHEWDKPVHHVRYFTPTTLQDACLKFGFQPTDMGSASSKAESPLETLDYFTPMERQVLRKLIDRFSPGPVWKHSFIILGCHKVSRSDESKRLL